MSTIKKMAQKQGIIHKTAFQGLHFFGGLIIGVIFGFAALLMFIWGIMTLPIGLLLWLVALFFAILAVAAWRAARAGPIEKPTEKNNR